MLTDRELRAALAFPPSRRQIATMTPVDLLIYDGMDLMDFGGPWEVFLTANRLLERRGEPPAFDPVAFSPDGQPVTSYGGLTVTPTGHARGAGVLVVPGAIGSVEPAAETVRSSSHDVIATVCTGALALGDKLPDRWTTHWEDLRPGAINARGVDAGNVVTGGGIACGIDVGLHLVARYTDSALARLVARQMDYPWDFYGDESGGTDPVVVEQVVATDPATLYATWTSSEGLLERFGITANVEPRIGGRYEFLFLLDQPEGLRGGEGCRILAMEPDRLLVFTWNSPPGFVTRGQHTWVVLTFTPVAQGTLLRLAHWGHGQGPDWETNREYFRAAWQRMLDGAAEAFK